jgi:tetratricopeptide (TPR) repeat protein
MPFTPKQVAIFLTIILICYSGFILWNRYQENFEAAHDYFEFGVDLEGKTQPQAALAYYSKAIELNSQYVNAYSARCRVLSNLERYEEALEDCNRAIKLDRNFARAYSNRCLVYAALEQPEQAMMDCSFARELDPASEYILHNQGLLFAQQGDDEKAIADYTRALELNPQYKIAYYNRGRTYFDLGEYELALIDFQQAAGIDANAFWPQYYIVWTQFELGNHDEAFGGVDLLIEQFPNNKNAYSLKTSMYDQFAKIKLVLASQNYLIEHDPEIETAAYDLDNVYYEADPYDVALSDYCRAVELGYELSQAVQDHIEDLGGCS